MNVSAHVRVSCVTLLLLHIIALFFFSFPFASGCAPRLTSRFLLGGTVDGPALPAGPYRCEAQSSVQLLLSDVSQQTVATRRTGQMKVPLLNSFSLVFNLPFCIFYFLVHSFILSLNKHISAEVSLLITQRKWSKVSTDDLRMER